MRISDWSSDVCSSDLHGDARAGFHEVAKDIVLRAIIDRDDMGPIISRLPISVRVERSQDTVRSRTTDGHLDFARCERGLVAFTESPNSAGPVARIRPAERDRKSTRLNSSH